MSRIEKVKIELPWQNRPGSIAPGHTGNRLRGVSGVKIVVGLGNPGREYSATRHNLGFMVVDDLARCLGASDGRNRFRSVLVEAFDDGRKIALVKPQTYMNLSGSSVREVLSWYKSPIADLLVVVDDIDLPFSAMRLRPRGGSGGHNGLKSIIASLGTTEFARLRIGIQPEHPIADPRRFVLDTFARSEREVVTETIGKSADAIRTIIRDGVLKAMAEFN